jgi:murein DD-endopeptidase MepM/ murein hydrolase activator NlpD
VSGRAWFLLLVAALLVGVAGFAWTRFEGSPPEIRAPGEVLVGAEGGSVDLEVVDPDSGLRSVTAVLSHPGGELTLAAQELPGTLLGGGQRRDEPLHLELAIDPGKLPRGVEQAFLRVTARDWSWRGGLGGNEARLDLPVTIDRKPPRISVATGLTYVRRGGAGVVVYTLGEPVKRDGVEVGDTFFRGYPLGERRVAFYAVPTDAPKNPSLRVVAEDQAGNVGRARWPVVVNERELPHADVRLPASFLDTVVPRLAAAEGIDASDATAAFQRINTEVRAANEARIRSELADSAPERLWEGAFEQLANSQVTSRFAEQRRYFVGGKPVSEATHFGYDLASTKAAPVTAAAAGRVVYADELGIYGNCVLVDHGLGVGSLYGHLSRVDVEPGQEVARGQTLGLSGATGLAGGDHLHFAILVGGVYVDPLEWWDPSWVRANVDARLAPSAP